MSKYKFRILFSAGFFLWLLLGVWATGEDFSRGGEGLPAVIMAGPLLAAMGFLFGAFLDD